MGDRFAYRVRVSGPGVEEYIRRVDSTISEHGDVFEWTGPRVLMAKREAVIDGFWYNVTASTSSGADGLVHQLLGNFSSAPIWFFVRPGTQRSGMTRRGGGPFDDLMLNVEIVGMSNSCDVPGGKYSYRTVIRGGKVAEDDGWTSLKAAIAHAPDLYAFAKDDR